MSALPGRARRLATAFLAALTGLATLVSPAVPAGAASTTLVINEVYARGGSANQPFTTKFVELYNASGSPVALSGYGLAYSSATNVNLGQTCALQGTVAAGGYFLVEVGSNGSNGAALPTPDQKCTSINPSGTAGAYTLTLGATIVDLVGWGTARRYETQAAEYPGTNPTPGSITRTAGADTDNNRADFTFTATPTPQNAGSPGTPTDPTTPTKTIAEIQGPGTASPLVGQRVATTGVVTAVYPTGGFNGFYFQTPGTGGPAKSPGTASDGIFVFGTTSVSAGQCVDVTGTVTEHYGLTELTDVEVVPAAAACDPVTPTPLTGVPVTDADKEAYEGMLVLPQGPYTITNNYQLNQYGQLGLAAGTEPLYQATDVVLPGPQAAAYEAENLKKYITLDDGSSWDYMRNRTAQNSALPYLSQTTPMRTDSQVTFVAPVILDYRYQWNFQPTGQVVGADSPYVPVAGENDREATPPAVGGDVKLGAFNVLNYFTDLGEQENQYRTCRYYADKDGNPVATDYCEVRGAYTEAAFLDQQAKLVAAINRSGADVLALMEIENSAGISYLPGQPRDKALAHLVSELNKAGGRWAYAPSPVVTPQGEDVIRLAYIYNPDRVQLLGASEILLDEGFANARYPLAQKFKARRSGRPFVAVANHFKSKGSGEDDGTGQGLSNPSRVAQAQALTTWVNSAYADEAVFLLGDFNAYSKEDPVRAIEAAGYTELVKAYEPQATSYQYQGRLGSLDHAFANPKARAMVTGAGVWDINADEAIAMQYSRRNYNAVDFYTPEPYASSDHDPVLVGISVGPSAKPRR